MLKGMYALITVLALTNLPIPKQEPVKKDIELPLYIPENNEIESLVQVDILHTNWTKGYDRRIDRQNRFNDEIRNALREWPVFDPLVFKSLIVQESEFRTGRRNRYGYAGIMQIGPREAKALGLIKRNADQRFTPFYAIPAAVKLLKRKTLFLELTAFKKYGTPQGDEYWKFVIASYNAGEGTIYKAMKIAYANNLPDSPKFADLVKTKTGNPWESPLVRAMPRRWRKVAKYKEIKNYVENVIKRARQS